VSLFRNVILVCILLSTAFAARWKALTKEEFFQSLHRNKGKPEAVLIEVKERGCDFRLSGSEEAQVLSTGANFGLLVQVKLNHKDNTAARSAQKRSQPAKGAAVAAPRTPRTP